MKSNKPRSHYAARDGGIVSTEIIPRKLMTCTSSANASCGLAANT